MPALEAVLDEIRVADVDQNIVGGDVLPGPSETLALLLDVAIPVHFIHGNGELAVLAQIGVTEPDLVEYWGTATGERLLEPHRSILRWTADQVHPRFSPGIRPAVAVGSRYIECVHPRIISMKHSARTAFVVLFGFTLPAPLHAQAERHAYVEAGAGATDVNGGIEWLVSDSPIGVGAELGAGWVFLGAVKMSYHLLARQTARHDLFATVGYMGLSSSEFSSHGVSVGGGGVYWPASRVGLRVDAFKYLSAKTSNNIRVEERSPSRYWGLRAGLAFRF